MAKSLTEIIADVRQHIAQSDSSNSQFTDAQLTLWINDAYRKIVVELRHLPIAARDYTVSAQSVTLNSLMVTVDTAKILNPSNGDYDLLKQIPLDELVEMDPNYESADSGVPTHFVRTGAFTAALYPPPSAAVIAQTTPLRLYGLEVPSDLASGSDTPSLPAHLHDVIGHWPAFRAFSQMENQVKAAEHIGIFNAALKAGKGVTTQFSRRLKGWRWESRLPDNA